MVSGSNRPSTRQLSTRQPAHRLRAVVWGSAVVLAAYAGFQVLVAWSTTTNLWWQSETLRLRMHWQFPTAVVAPAQPMASWQAWLPSAATAAFMVAALVVAALSLVCAGRGWWLLLPAAIPLVPTQLVPGVWAPPLSNQVLYALVWPASATVPSTAWTWVSACIETVVVALPAVALNAVVIHRRPSLFSAEVARRLLPGLLAVAAVAVWEVNADHAPDWGLLGRQVLWAAIAAMLFFGGLRRRLAVPLLVVLPALAGGLLRWSAGADGTTSITVDSAAWGLSVAALVGAVWVAVQPLTTWPVRRWRKEWAAQLAAGGASADVEPADASRESAEPVSHRAPAAPAGAGGRHRG
jgi:hypothetical protein